MLCAVRHNAGQLGFYVSLVDEQLRRPDRHAPTVGILLCAARDDRIVHYALAGTAKPIAVADYLCDTGATSEHKVLPTGADLAAVVDETLSSDEESEEDSEVALNPDE